MPWAVPSQDALPDGEDHGRLGTVGDPAARLRAALLGVAAHLTRTITKRQPRLWEAGAVGMSL